MSTVNTPTDKPDEIVTFLLEDGSVVSQDPRHMRKLFEDQIIAQQALTSANSAVGDPDLNPHPRPQDVELANNTERSGDEPEPSKYASMKVDELKELAAERELDISGMKKKSELVAALDAQDADVQA